MQKGWMGYGLDSGGLIQVAEFSELKKSPSYNELKINVLLGFVFANYFTLSINTLPFGANS
jgi:hypothetical protein